MKRSELIEAMARAICLTEHEDPDWPVGSEHHREVYYPSFAGQPLWKAYADPAEAALAALEARDLVVVPREATVRMIAAAIDATDTDEDFDGIPMGDLSKRIWTAMLLASQEPQT